MNQTCKFCSRTFSRGKALEGHIKIHHLNPNFSSENQENDECEVGFDCKCQSNHVLRNNPKKSLMGIDGNGSVEVGEYVCDQCGKGFKSDKALYGHMKIHGKSTSKAHNRYIIPSPVRKKRSRTRYLFDHKLCCSNSNGVSSFVDVKDDDEDKELNDFAVCLLMLSKGGFYSPADSDEFNSLHLGPTVGFMGTQMDGQDELDVGFDDHDHNEFDFDLNLPASDYEFDNQLNSDVHFSQLCYPSLSSEIGHSYDLNNAESVPKNLCFNGINAEYTGVTSVNEEILLVNSNASYEMYADTEDKSDFSCRICGKVFQSGYALRGHGLHCPVSRKRFPKKKSVKSSQTYGGNDEWGSLMEVENQKISMVGTKMCSVCYMVFQFENEFEDHMQSHFECIKTVEIPSVDVVGESSHFVEEEIDQVQHRLCSYEFLRMMGFVSY